MPTKVQTLELYSGVADGSGDATATSDVISGKILAIAVAYDSGSAAGTDTTVTAKVGSVAQTVLGLTNSNTDAVYYPRAYAEDTAGTDLTYDGTNEIATEFPVNGTITITVAQQTAAKGVKIYVILEVF